MTLVTKYKVIKPDVEINGQLREVGDVLSRDEFKAQGEEEPMSELEQLFDRGDVEGISVEQE